MNQFGLKFFHFVIITLNFVTTDFHYKFLCHYNSLFIDI